jgi:predicted HicB family RNase H-like nuclease
MLGFEVRFEDHGRFGVAAVEPRTGVRCTGDSIEEVRREMHKALRDYVEIHGAPSPEPDAPVQTIEIIVI